MVTKRKGSRYYWVRFQWNGQEIRRSARTASRSEALEYERKLREELGRVYRGGKSRHTYNEAMTRFIEEYLPGLKKTSATRYIVSARALHSSFNHLYLDQIGKARIADFIALRKRDGVGATGIRRDLACLSSMLSSAVRWDWIDFNPVKGIDKRDLKEAPGRIRFLTPDEFSRLRAECPLHLMPLVQFAVETGMRFEEQFSLAWSQVDLIRKEIRLTVTKSGTARTVPLSPLAYVIIAKLTRHIHSPWVFWHGNGDRYRVVRRSFQNALRRAKIQDFRWHDLRHTFASWSVQNGMDLYTLQRILGHSDPKMTQRYAHLRTEDLHKALKKVGTKAVTRKRD